MSVLPNAHLVSRNVFEVSIESLLQSIGLDTALAFYKLNCKSQNLPYHNKRHTYNMVGRCYRMATEYHLPMQSLKQLLLAALFHDFNHSGKSTGIIHDRHNIEAAIAAVKDFFYSLENGACPEFNQQDLFNVCRIIACTEFPFAHEPITIEQRIIRDADLLEISEPGWYSHVILGLSEELGIQEVIMVQNQATFLEACTFYTKVGQRIFDQYLILMRIELKEHLKRLTRVEC